MTKYVVPFLDPGPYIKPGEDPSNDAGQISVNELAQDIQVLAPYTQGIRAQVVINVSRATLTVKANDAGRPFGAANPSFTDTISGFVNGDTPSVVSGAASLTTTANIASAVSVARRLAAVGRGVGAKKSMP